MEISLLNKNLTYGSRKSVRDKADKLSDEFMAASAGTLTLRKISDTIGRYSPNIVIAESAGNENSGAYFSYSYTYDKGSNQLSVENPIVLFNQKRATSQLAKANMLGTAVHEMVHVFQTSENQYSRQPLSIKFLQNHSIDDFILHTGVADKIYEKLTSRFVFNTVRKLFTKPHDELVSDLNKTLADKKKVSEFLKKSFDNAKKLLPNIDLQFIKKYLYITLAQEQDAYYQGCKVRKKMLGLEDSLVTELDVPHLLLEHLEKVVRYTKNN